MADQPAEVREAGQVSGPHPPGARRAARLALALVVVWGLSLGAFALHVTGPLALVWLILAIYYLPLGSRVSDRIMAIAALGAAAVSLIAWVSPQVPPLLHPATLTGLLGTAPAVVWARRGTPRIRPKFPRSDWVALTCGAIAGILWWLPLRDSSISGLLNALFSGPDNAAHVTMFRGVWGNHGYEIVHVGPTGSSAYVWQAYPEGAHAALAAIGSVATGVADRPSVELTLQTYAALLAGLAGFLSLTLAWGVARLAYRYRTVNSIALTVCQVLPALLLLIGPGAWILMCSPSYLPGVALTIIASVTAVTTNRHPRRGALIIGASAAATCAAYPLLGVFIPLVWVAFLWSARHFWLSCRVWGLTCTVIVALTCSPMFLLLAFRDTRHGLTEWGIFEPIPPMVSLTATALLCCALILGRIRVPLPMLTLAWVSLISSFSWSLLAIITWIQFLTVRYYAVKMMYSSLLLSAVVIASTIVPLAARWRSHHTRRSPRTLARRISVSAVATILAAGSFSGGLLMEYTERSSMKADWWRTAPGLAHISGAMTASDAAVLFEITQRSAEGLTFAVYLPCNNNINHWLSTLAGRYDEADVMVRGLTCSVADVTRFSSTTPNVTLEVYTLSESIYLELNDAIAKHDLKNVRVHKLEQ